MFYNIAEFMDTIGNIRIRVQKNKRFQPGNVIAQVKNSIQQLLSFNKRHGNFCVVNNIGEFAVGYITPSRYIGSTAELYAVIGQYPLKPIIAKKSNMIAGINPHLNKPGGEIYPPFIKLFK